MSVQQARESSDPSGSQQDPVVRRDSPDYFFQWVLLILASAVMLAALLLKVRNEEQVLLPGTEIPLPEICSFRRLFAIDCPGCGLTRCFISMAHGQVSAAWRFHPIGVFFFILVAGQIPFRAVQLLRMRRGAREWSFGLVSHIAVWSLVAGLLMQWVFQTIF